MIGRTNISGSKGFINPAITTSYASVSASTVGFQSVNALTIPENTINLRFIDNVFVTASPSELSQAPDTEVSGDSGSSGSTDSRIKIVGPGGTYTIFSEGSVGGQGFDYELVYEFELSQLSYNKMLVHKITRGHNDTDIQHSYGIATYDLTKGGTIVVETVLQSGTGTADAKLIGKYWITQQLQ